ncbi:unnamed protein product [Protopolystoma xenopodis]|uniref:Uncharacterized protein n=1 Tax=Protopolystoma xenopodis TaxID=117903 RepID=A0A3S5B2L8_9PLAT|nr:unnamed protein product [Protopolystoma xenopodis]
MNWKVSPGLQCSPVHGTGVFIFTGQISLESIGSKPPAQASVKLASPARHSQRRPGQKHTFADLRLGLCRHPRPPPSTVSTLSCLSDRRLVIPTDLLTRQPRPGEPQATRGLASSRVQPMPSRPVLGHAYIHCPVRPDCHGNRVPWRPSYSSLNSWENLAGQTSIFAIGTSGSTATSAFGHPAGLVENDYEAGGEVESEDLIYALPNNRLVRVDLPNVEFSSEQAHWMTRVSRGL